MTAHKPAAGVRLINRPTKDGGAPPQTLAVRYALENGFTLRREPFGKRGSLIEVWRSGRMVGHRKGYRAVLALMVGFYRAQSQGE